MTDRFSQSVTFILYLIAGMLPVLFLPVPFGAETGREIAFGVLAAAGGILWLIATLAKGEIRYPVSPLLWAAGVLAAVWIASAALGAAPYASLFFADASAERLATLSVGLVLMLVTAGGLGSRGEAGIMLFVLMFSGAIAALLSLYTFLVGPLPFVPMQPYFNVIGTLNGLALFYSALFMMAVGLLLSPAAGAWKGWIRWALAAAAVLFLLDLLLIHFRTAWIVLLGSAVCLFGFLLIDISKYRNIEIPRRFAWRQWVALCLVLFCIVMLMAPAGALKTLDVPLEVSPSFSATFALAGSVFREGPVRVFLGSGPGTFGLDWARYKDASINQTVFWNIRFNQGQSWVATALPTVGVLGFVALAGFLGGALFVFLRMMLRVPLPALPLVERMLPAGQGPESAVPPMERAIGSGTRGNGATGTGIAPSTSDNIGSGGMEQPLVMSAFLGSVPILIAAFLYPANTSLMLLFFLAAGILTFLLAVPLPSSAADVAGAPQHGTAGTGEIAPSATERALNVGQHLQRDAEHGNTGEGIVPSTSDNFGSGTRGNGATGTGIVLSTSGNIGSGTAQPAPPAPKGFWDIRERRIGFETPWVVFASSLAIIFCVALGIAAFYGEVGRIRAERAADRGVRAFREGKIDQAAEHLERAARHAPHNWRMIQILTQIRIEKVRRIIQEAAGGTDVRQEFQSAVSLAIQDSQRLTQMHPREPELWRIQGVLYEMVIPFIQGSERFAVAAFQRATELEPLNPAGYVDWGRAGLVFTDRIATLAQQAQAKEREELLAARAQHLGEIAQIFPRAIQVKPDYAPAHFLLAQTYIRLGNLDSAIQSVENARQAAPFDIGVAFQLGLLYYQKENFDRAEQEFGRAVTLNENYSNARYFLGLLYDRKKDTQKALAEFERIAALNPDNQEVARVITNLKAGKPALTGIVPPAIPPQERTDVPVKEQETKR